MNYKNLVIAAALILSSAIISNAQTTASSSENLEFKLSENELIDWAIFSDLETSTFYIDFESLKVIPTEIVVYNQNGEKVISEDVLGLPHDSIYELDLSNKQPGKFKIEVHSYIGTFKKIVDTRL